MKTLVIANQKGGVGKTATIVHLAFDFLERGKNVAVIDLDTQGNASYTLRDYQGAVESSLLFQNEELPDLVQGRTACLTLIGADAALANIEKMPMDAAIAHFRAGVAQLAGQGFDICLIDTAPALGTCMITALFSADAVLSPIELEAYSIQGIKKMVTIISNVRKANPQLQFLGMLPSKVDGRNPRHTQHQRELNTAYAQLMIPLSIGLRSSIADALSGGMPVWQIRKTAARKAAQEVRALAGYVFEKMEIAT